MGAEAQVLVEGVKLLAVESEETGAGAVSSGAYNATCLLE